MIPGRRNDFPDTPASSTTSTEHDASCKTHDGYADLNGPTDLWAVMVRPGQVVEAAFDGLQVSTRYPGVMALRFARELRYRDDKRPDGADTISSVRTFYDSH